MAVPWRSLVEGDEQGPSGELWLWNTKNRQSTQHTQLYSKHFCTLGRSVANLINILQV